MIPTIRANSLMPKRVQRLLALIVLFSVIMDLFIIAGAVISFVHGDTLVGFIFLASLCPFVFGTLLVAQEIKNEHGYNIHLTENIQNIFLNDGIEFRKNTITFYRAKSYNFKGLTPKKEKSLFFITKDSSIIPEPEIQVHKDSLIIKFNNKREFLYALAFNILEARKIYKQENTDYFLMGIYYLLNSSHADKELRAKLCYENDLGVWQTGLTSEISYPTEDLPLIKILPVDWLEKLLVPRGDSLHQV